MRTRCAFSAADAHWICQNCGRRVPKAKDKPPIATCSSSATRAIHFCRFEPSEDGMRRCQSCGLEVAAAPDATIVAICGRPETLRIVDASRHSGGVGTELKKLLARIGIHATPGCKCTQRALIMDMRGIEWCDANILTIVGWLREESTKRGLPFVDAAGKMLVRRAIANARRAAASRG